MGGSYQLLVSVGVWCGTVYARACILTEQDVSRFSQVMVETVLSITKVCRLGVGGGWFIL